MPSTQIQWFPGHMAKTRRLISENLKNVDLIIEILDARIPYSSRNPELPRLTGNKPTLVLLNKSALADPEKTKRWAEHYRSDTVRCLAIDCLTGEGINRILPTVQDILKEKTEKYESRGMAGRRLRAMILGIPNVGKSTLINKLVGNKKAKVENRPGVTVDKAWYSTSIGIDLMDMPGLLWPKFEDQIVGENLAITGAIKDAVLDIETIAMKLCGRLREQYPALMLSRYPIAKEAQELDGLSDWDLVEAIGRRRGMLISGGEVNTERTAIMLIDEFRSAKIGRITLDVLPKSKQNAKESDTNDQ
ncbi:MAG: ribosome biogenesis GTPase YlqF [Ruminococcaceae bacterium]|nr:ribosome biogenesis GTPase YlqF [Oscillospiraceae bacterium]